MRKNILIGMMVLVCGAASAQTKATFPKEEAPRERGETEAFRLEETQHSLTEKQRKSKTVKEEKTVITKEMWESQSERGRSHILAHPELYIVEQ